MMLAEFDDYEAFTKASTLGRDRTHVDFAFPRADGKHEIMASPPCPVYRTRRAQRMRLAAAAMILAAFGHPVTMDELRRRYALHAAD